jgi:hypothetical protein
LGAGRPLLGKSDLARSQEIAQRLPGTRRRVSEQPRVIEPSRRLNRSNLLESNGRESVYRNAVISISDADIRIPKAIRALIV